MSVRSRIVWTALFALAVHASVIGVKVATHPSHSLLAVFRVGELRHPPFVEAEGYPVERGGSGTDGQQYLYVAHDPRARDPAIAGALDEPRYRYGRILLPALAAATCGGSSPCLPRAIVLYNLIFAGGIGALLALLIADRHAHPAWAFTLAAAGSLVLATDIANVELCAQCFALAGIALAARGRVGAAAAAFACAALARETYALVPIGFALAAVRQGRSGRGQALAYLAACVPLGLWMCHLRTVLPGPMGVGSNVGVPFGGIAFWVADLVRRPRIDSAVFNRFAIGMPLVAMMVRHASTLRRHASGLAIAAALVSALGLCATAQVWRSPGGFARAMDFLYPAITLTALEVGDAPTAWLSLSSLMFAVSTVGDHLRHTAG